MKIQNGLRFSDHYIAVGRDTIENSIADAIHRDLVQAVVAFGSCLRPAKRRWLFFKQKPNDLDIVVFIKTNQKKFNKKKSIVLHRLNRGSYGYDWLTDYDTDHFLHLMSTTQDEWIAALQTKNVVAQAILEGLVLYTDGTLEPLPKFKYETAQSKLDHYLEIKATLIKQKPPPEIDIQEELFRPPSKEDIPVHCYGYSLGE